MPTTSTYSYNPTATTLITDALRYLGAIEEGGVASSAQITDCLPSFELYIKGLGKYGLLLWTITTESVTLVAGTVSYVPTNKFLKLTDIIYRDSEGEDTRLTPLSRQEYWDLSNKDQDSNQPTQFYYDPQETALESKIYIWPVPDATGAGNGETLEVTGNLLLEDVGDGSYTLDVPQEWLETIKYGLATRLAPMYGYPTSERQILLAEYQNLLRESLLWDTEQESIYFQPQDYK
jgi:hypothetical protein